MADERKADEADERKATEAVLMESQPVPQGTPIVRGYDFTPAAAAGVDYGALLASYRTTGFQATSLGQAMDEINRMLRWRLSDEPIAPDETELLDPAKRAQYKCKIFFSYTSNLVSCGLREIIRFLVQHRLVDYVITTAGGVEEDFIKCLRPTYVAGSFDGKKGAELRESGFNRIGNLFVPNENYGAFEDWLTPILDSMLREQTTEGKIWTPSRFIERLGREINNPESIYYWAAKNNIPVFCPALTDGSIGDMLFFHSVHNDPGLIIDIVGDIRRLNLEAIHARKSGMVILGGGLAKHHNCNANLMRNGADFAVFVNTAGEFDGSDAGARPDEAVSWGKIKAEAKPVKVFADATLVFPLIVAETFVPELRRRLAEAKAEPAVPAPAVEAVEAKVQAS